MTDVKKNQFTFAGKRYFRGNAPQISLGSYGVKKTPAFQANYLEGHGKLGTQPLRRVTVERVGPYTIEWNKVSRRELDVNVSYIGNNGVAVALTKEKAESASLVVIKLFVNVNDAIRLINANPSVLKCFKDYPQRARLVTSVWVVVEAEIASRIKNTASLTGTGTYNGFTLDIAASGGSTTNQRITIPKGATFAYMMHSAKRWSKRRGRRDSVLGLEDDQHGPY